jgi:exonuclease SbcC
MLESLTIKNFQCHQKIVLDLNHPIISVVGPSDAGKTALLRALRWLACNQPNGLQFLRMGAAGVGVSLQVDRTSVARSRNTAGSNLYRFGDKRYVSFGTNVPEPIAQFLNLGPVNFQFQHDAPFWFMLSSGEVSRELNQVVNLDLIDTTQANIAAELRQTRAIEAVCQQRLTRARADRDALAWVKGAQSDFFLLEQKKSDIEETKQKRTRIVAIVAEGQRLEASLQNASLSLPEAKKVVLLGERLQKTTARRQRLQELFNSATVVQKRTTVQIPSLDKLESLVQKLKQAARRREKLVGLVRSIKVAQEALWQSEDALGQATRALQKVSKGRCVACGQELTIRSSPS